MFILPLVVRIGLCICWMFVRLKDRQHGKANWSFSWFNMKIVMGVVI